MSAHKTLTHKGTSIDQEVRNNYLVNASSFNRALAYLFIIVVMPVMLFNSLWAMLKRAPVFSAIRKQDALGRLVVLHYFRYGILKHSGLLLDIAQGRLNFCGVHFSNTLTLAERHTICHHHLTKAGIFNHFSLHQSSGLIVENEARLLIKQLNTSSFACLLMVCKSLLCRVLYHQNNSTSHKYVKLFDLTINNTSLAEVAAWATAADTMIWPRVGFFINVNSINLACQSAQFKHHLKQPVALFADGSGMRIAAKHAGYQLKSNINGTDLLPILCQCCAHKKQSIFLFGAGQGIAEKTAKTLKQQHPQLLISGTHHGYVASQYNAELIQKINDSKCDVLLVALGSPLQESWVLANRHALHCQCILAVGGLFDFYAGKYSRAPLSLRQLGLEWIWRLWQDPKGKFYRYVIGNPLFLIRVYILGLATKGEK